MITEAIYGVFCKIVAFLLELLPSWERPTWIADLISTVTDSIGQVSQLGYWLPLEHLAICAGALLTISAVAYGIRIGRITLSALTGGGGSAA